MDLAKITQNAAEREFDVETEKLGKLHFRYLSAGRSEALHGLDLDAVDSQPFIDALIKSLAVREDGKPLAASESGELTFDEREAFAKAFLEANEYLVREKTYERKQNEAGTVTVSVRYDGEVTEKGDGESQQMYLWRCWSMRERDHRKRMKKIADSVGVVGQSVSKAVQTLDTRFGGDPFVNLNALSGYNKVIEDITRSNRLLSEHMAGFKAIDFAGLNSLISANRSIFDAIHERYHLDRSVFRDAIEAMNSPWLNVAEKLRSATAFAELQGMGSLLRTMPSFAEATASALRLDLGDWRDPVTWSPVIFEEANARSAFYGDKGLDPALTDMPPEAFDESLDIAGLRSPPPTLVELYGDPIGPTDEGFARTNLAHDFLMRFESELRQFIDKRMTAVFGSDWMQKRLPKGMLERWTEKRNAEVTKGRPAFPLIAYADFTDYLPIIELSANWRDVFQSAFVRPETVRESLQRLYPIRICTMHARIITQEDELYMFVEIKRMMATIRSLGSSD